MNPIERAKTWIDILLNPALAGLIRPHRQGKHTNGSKPSPRAHKQRRERNKRERQARAAMYKRAKV